MAGRDDVTRSFVDDARALHAATSVCSSTPSCFSFFFSAEVDDAGMPQIDTVHPDGLLDFSHRYPNIAQFGFPEASERKPTRSFFVFALTDRHGVQQFVHCHRTLYGKLYGFVSQYPWVRFFHSCLLHFVDNHYSMDVVYELHHAEVPLPNDVFHVGFSSDLRRPPDYCNPFCDSFLGTFVATHPQGFRLCVAAVAALLHEKQIIVVGNDASVVSNFIFAVLGLLYPFRWQHVLVPLLPASLIDVVCAPTPFLVGIHDTLLPTLVKLPVEAEVIDCSYRDDVIVQDRLIYDFAPYLWETHVAPLERGTISRAVDRVFATAVGGEGAHIWEGLRRGVIDHREPPQYTRRAEQLSLKVTSYFSNFFAAAPAFFDRTAQRFGWNDFLSAFKAPGATQWRRCAEFLGTVTQTQLFLCWIESYVRRVMRYTGRNVMYRDLFFSLAAARFPEMYRVRRAVAAHHASQLDTWFPHGGWAGTGVLACCFRTSEDSLPDAARHSDRQFSSRIPSAVQNRVASKRGVSTDLAISVPNDALATTSHEPDLAHISDLEESNEEELGGALHSPVQGRRRRYHGNVPCRGSPSTATSHGTNELDDEDDEGFTAVLKAPIPGIPVRRLPHRVLTDFALFHSLLDPDNPYRGIAAPPMAAMPRAEHALKRPPPPPPSS